MVLFVGFVGCGGLARTLGDPYPSTTRANHCFLGSRTLALYNGVLVFAVGMTRTHFN